MQGTPGAWPAATGGRTSAERPLGTGAVGGQLPGISRIVTMTEPSSAAVGVGAASQGWNRSGSLSSGWELHSQQMNLARLSSSQGVGGGRGGWLAVLSAARVAAD